MVDAYLQGLLDEPIKTAARANRLWLPKGKKSADTRSPEERAADNAAGRLKRERNAQVAERKRSDLLDYYAASAVPVERIAQHVGIGKAAAKVEMEKRGRRC